MLIILIRSIRRQWRGLETSRRLALILNQMKDYLLTLSWKKNNNYNNITNDNNDKFKS